MSKPFLTCLCLLLTVLALPTEAADTISVARFGARANSFENATQAVQQAIAVCRTQGDKVLKFDNGRYDFWPEGATRREYYITNTSSETECPSKVKTIGLLFDRMQHLTLEGNGATLVFHGKMTMLALDHCNDIRLHNLHFDFERPGGSELTYVSRDSDGVVLRLHRDSRYALVNKRLHLIGEGWQSNRNHCIEYDTATAHFEYTSDFNQILAKADVEELAPGVLKFHTPPSFRPQPGNTLTVRDIIRDQVGMFLAYSRNITLQQVHVHYMHGLGIVSQYSRNITMDHVYCEPRQGSGRLLASSADFMHFSGCAGKISVRNCRFVGAQDDAINMHGTNLRVVEQVDAHTVKLRFMHPQTYGFDAFFPGDSICFVHARTMLRYAASVVQSVSRLDARTLLLTVNRHIPAHVVPGHDCVENLTWTPEVEISHNFFTRTSTRGTLVTTPPQSGHHRQHLPENRHERHPHRGRHRELV